MLRDHTGHPVGDPDWFVHHGTDVETAWDGDVPHLWPPLPADELDGPHS